MRSKNGRESCQNQRINARLPAQIYAPGLDDLRRFVLDVKCTGDVPLRESRGGMRIRHRQPATLLFVLDFQLNLVEDFRQAIELDAALEGLVAGMHE